MNLTRRELAPLTLSIAAACASPAPPATAQPRRPPAREPDIQAVPAPQRQGDVAGLVLSGTGIPGQSVVALGHAFERGALPRGATLSARLLQGGRELEVQTQVLTRHPDGSARLVLIAVVSPALAAGHQAPIVLARSGGARP